MPGACRVMLTLVPNDRVTGARVLAPGSRSKKAQEVRCKTGEVSTAIVVMILDVLDPSLGHMALLALLLLPQALLGRKRRDRWQGARVGFWPKNVRYFRERFGPQKVA